LEISVSQFLIVIMPDFIINICWSWCSLIPWCFECVI